MKTTILCVLASSLSFVACNPCSTPAVPASTVIVTNESGGAVDGVVLTAQRGDSTVTFNCSGGSSAASDDGAASSDASADGAAAAPAPTDGSSGAPIAGTRCVFTGGLGEAPITLRAQAPGFLPLERVVTMSELSMPTGCGFALNLSIVMRRQ